MLVEELRQSPQQLLRDAEAHPNRAPWVSAGAPLTPGLPGHPCGGGPTRGLGPPPRLSQPRRPSSRKADLEQSDGEEDFYYTELDVDVDSLTDGLSSLTPVSPTSSVPPAFPGTEAPALLSPKLPLASPLSPPAAPPGGLCHVHTDHAYQVRPPPSPAGPRCCTRGCCSDFGGGVLSSPRRAARPPRGSRRGRSGRRCPPRRWR